MAIDKAKQTSVGPGEERAVERLRALVRLMDEAVAIPGTGIRIGLDGLIGLVPGIGDAAGAIVSAWLVLASIRLGVGAPIAARMLLNIGVDTLVGLVPLLGDLFDIGWKANRRNLDLLEAWRLTPHRTRRRSALLLGAVTAGVLGTVVAVIWAAVSVFRGVLGWLVGSAAPLP
ncbi:MAG: DUF4112 domain-containing protein [Gemmatimonadales bacterium]